MAELRKCIWNAASEHKVYLGRCVMLSAIPPAGERDGSFCWQCWSLRRKIGLEGPGGPPRNARKCTIIAAAELKRLMTIISSVRPAKRSRQV